MMSLLELVGEQNGRECSITNSWQRWSMQFFRESLFIPNRLLASLQFSQLSCSIYLLTKQWVSNKDRPPSTTQIRPSGRPQVSLTSQVEQQWGITNKKEGNYSFPSISRSLLKDWIPTTTIVLEFGCFAGNFIILIVVTYSSTFAARLPKGYTSPASTS
jgi:hypothetical protein